MIQLHLWCRRQGQKAEYMKELLPGSQYHFKKILCYTLLFCCLSFWQLTRLKKEGIYSASKLDKNTIPSLYSSDDFRARSSHAIVESIFSRQCGRRSHYIVSLLKNSGTVLPSCAELPCTPASHLFHVLFVSPATLRRVHSWSKRFCWGSCNSGLCDHCFAQKGFWDDFSIKHSRSVF